jgi:crotonobetainyl-CoA:carnitine CoA-transferase CaiB-like acyl-CoA transferase
MCEKAGLPFSRIARPWDLFEDAHLKASGGLLPITLPDGRPCAVPALPIQFGSERLGVRLDLPKIGEHTEEVLGPLRAGRDAAE